MSFLSPWYLLGLLGIGIPLAIHLIRRQQAERVVLPTVRFLKRAPKKLVYFQRLQQLLLLTLRIVILGLLALAFARPIFTGAFSQLVGAIPQSLVILLDTSMSMQYADRFETGRSNTQFLDPVNPRCGCVGSFYAEPIPSEPVAYGGMF